jgi:hypothetical protein
MFRVSPGSRSIRINLLARSMCRFRYFTSGDARGKNVIGSTHAVGAGYIQPAKGASI